MLKKTGGKLGKVVEYTSYPEAYQDLALKRVDYVVNTIINIKALVAEKPAVFEVGQAVSASRTRPGRWPKDKQDGAGLHERLHRQGKSPAAGSAKLQKKWFGEVFADLPVTFEPEF